jgi:putative phage-type endonuclease
MKQHLLLTSTNDMSQEDWLKYRKRGIGASEVGTVMGLNPYKSSIELFYEKIGEELGYTVENIAMFMGKEQEPFMAKLWQFWDGDQESVIRNWRSNTIVRRCQRVNAYVNNPRFPWLFVSLDRKINHIEGKGEGALELKTIEAWEAEKWENEIPPSYAVQVQTQILVCEFLWGELFTMKNGRHLECLPFDVHNELQDKILTLTKEFWDKVEKGRGLVTRRFQAKHVDYNHRLAEELTAELQAIEPPPDGSDAYSKFLKEKYQIAEPGERPGTLDQLAWAQLHMGEKKAIKATEESAQLYEQLIKNSMRDGCTKIDFGPNGHVSWKPNINGVRVFLNKTK